MKALQEQVCTFLTVQEENSAWFFSFLFLLQDSGLRFYLQQNPSSPVGWKTWASQAESPLAPVGKQLHRSTTCPSQGQRFFPETVLSIGTSSHSHLQTMLLLMESDYFSKLFSSTAMASTKCCLAELGWVVNGLVIPGYLHQVFCSPLWQACHLLWRHNCLYPAQLSGHCFLL